MFFTTINYLGLQDMDGNVNETTIDTNTTVFLLTGIANAQPLVSHLKKHFTPLYTINYPDLIALA